MSEEITIENTGGEKDFEKYFSYSLDSMISSFDDAEILKSIIEKYPQFLPSTPEKDLRKMFLDILLDRKLIKYITKYYAINLKELITIVYQNYPFIFTSSVYVRKLFSTVKQHRYLKCAAKKIF